MNWDECEAAGIDPAKVSRYQKRLEKLLKEMRADNIAVFGGEGSSLRPFQAAPDVQLLILAHLSAANLDGGAGASGFRGFDDGLQRGEG